MDALWLFDAWDDEMNIREQDVEPVKLNRLRHDDLSIALRWGRAIADNTPLDMEEWVAAMFDKNIIRALAYSRALQIVWRRQELGRDAKAMAAFHYSTNYFFAMHWDKRHNGNDAWRSSTYGLCDMFAITDFADGACDYCYEYIMTDCKCDITTIGTYSAHDEFDHPYKWGGR